MGSDFERKHLNGDVGMLVRYVHKVLKLGFHHLGPTYSPVQGRLVEDAPQLERILPA